MLRARFHIRIRPRHPRINPRRQRRPTLLLPIIRNQTILLTSLEQETLDLFAANPIPRNQSTQFVPKLIKSEVT